MSLTLRNVVNRELEFFELDGNFQWAETKAAEAQAARDAAVLFANVFDSTALGLAGTTNGQYFTVPGTGSVYLNLYKNNAGAAGFVTSIGTFLGGTLTGALNYAPPVNIASAASIDIGAAASNIVAVTGTASISALGTIAYGTERILWAFNGAFTLVHNATSLILPGGTNITATSGEYFTFMSLGSGNWRMSGRHYAGPLARTDVANTFSGANTFADGQVFGANSGATNVIIRGGAGAIRALRFRTAGVDRIVGYLSATAEGGANAGSDYGMANYDDAGAFISTILTIKRSDGGVFIGSPTGSSKGAGTLNAINLYVQNSPVLKQSDIFVSADQVITLAGALTLAHGLGTAPRVVDLMLVCQTAELGYSIGDVVTASGSYRASIFPDDTNLGIRYSGTAMSVAHKTSGTSTSITAANWKARFLAIK